MLKYYLTNSTVANEETYIKPLLLCHHIQDIVDAVAQPARRFSPAMQIFAVH